VAMRYIEQNPVRARLVKRAEEYEWSSAAGHTGGRVDPLLSDRQGLLGSVDDWTDWLRSVTEDESLARLRLYTRTGRPLGAAEFVERLEHQVGRALDPKPRGRPRKVENG